jgi:predicted esterase
MNNFNTFIFHIHFQGRRHTWAQCVGVLIGVGIGIGIEACSPQETHTRPKVQSANSTAKVDLKPTSKTNPNKKTKVSATSKLPRPKLTSTSPFIELEVPGFAPAVVSIPQGAQNPIPVLVAAHGNYDRPEWQCEIWREMVKNRGFVLCPRGVKRFDSPSRQDTRYEYSGIKQLGNEITAAIEALHTRFPNFMTKSDMIFLGFSQGAIYGSLWIQSHAEIFSRLILIEGGQRMWVPLLAKRYATTGAHRVLFGCGQAGCFASSTQSVRALERSGVPARVVFKKHVGHTYDGIVFEQINESFSWVTDGLSHWHPAHSQPQSDH